MHLSPEHLDAVDGRVAVPRYDRGGLARSIVHIGVGGFHRAHLASYVDEIAASGYAAWGIVGAGILPRDAAMAEALDPQGGLYTLVERDRDGVDARVIGSLVAYLHASPALDPLVGRIADPDTRIVSLTVTEGGYPVVDETGEFDARSPNAGPGSAFAAIVRGLRQRHDRGLGPVTVLSCDNITGNGTASRVATLGVAEACDPGLVPWIEGAIAFPNSMVDRITPATTDADRAWLSAEFGLEDRWPVMTEPFRQWVVEDRFAAGRPPLEDLEVIVTDDVDPYEECKLRLLNAAHSCLAYLARLLEIERVDEVMAEPRFTAFVRRFLADEAGPTVPAAPGIDLVAYQDSLVTRFANPAIGDQVERLCLDGSPKFPKFLLPTVRAQLAAGGPVELAALALAGWCQYLTGRTEAGGQLPPASDPHLPEAQRHARASLAEPAAFLAFRRVFGDDLPADDRFVTAFTEALWCVRTDGVRGAIDRTLAGRTGAVRD